MSLLLTVTVCAVVVLQCTRFGQLQKTLEEAQLDKLTPELSNAASLSTTATGKSKRDGNGDPNQNVKGCVCVPSYLCKNTTEITSSEGLIDSRIQEINCRPPEVCCQSDPIYSPPPVEPKPSGFEPEPRGCGYRNPDGVGFRMNDKYGELQFGEFPWMVALLRKESDDNQTYIYQCGGALVHPQAVVTGAHCVFDKAKRNGLKIRAGEWDTQTTDEIYPYQDRSVNKVIVHEQFYRGGLFNDIALLILDQPVEIAENVNVVCLPPQDTVTRNGTRCFTSGWGKDVYGQTGRYKVIPKRAELPIVGHDACQEELRKTRLGKLFELHNSFTCAGGDGKDTCQAADGGSALVCPIEYQPNRYYQAGIVAWGINCGGKNIPAVYVDIAKFISWINEQMTSNQLDINAYSYA